MTNFNKYNSSFRIIRRFIRVAQFYGYKLSIQNKHTGSCYVAFCKKEQSTMEFIFRFSDHCLKKNNQIPAGVINERTNLKNCVRDIQYYHKMYNKMSIIEKEELWTNREVY